MSENTLGILGVGHLASYTVKGLRRGGDYRDIILSPRGQTTAQDLAKQCNCRIAESNQAVIDQSDMILLAVRPAALAELLEGLKFRQAQCVISVIAGVDLQSLRSYPPLQQCDLFRALPSASAEVNAGPVPIFPDHTGVNRLFSSLGQVVPLQNEELFDTALAHACLHGWSYFLVQALIDWSMQQGMDETTARQMVAHSIGSAISFAEANPESSYQAIGKSIATEGTFTLKGIDHIRNSGGVLSWVEAMDIVASKSAQPK